MKRIGLILALSCLLNCGFVAEGKTRFAAATGVRQGSAITRVVQNYVSRHSADVGKVRITKSDVQGEWASIWATPRKGNLDTVQLLLHKQKSGWKVLEMGTSLEGTGATDNVPKRLRKRWNL